MCKIPTQPPTEITINFYFSDAFTENSTFFFWLAHSSFSFACGRTASGTKRKFQCYLNIWRALAVCLRVPNVAIFRAHTHTRTQILQVKWNHIQNMSMLLKCCVFVRLLHCVHTLGRIVNSIIHTRWLDGAQMFWTLMNFLLAARGQRQRRSR